MFGATLQIHGVTRDKSSMSSESKSTPASCAAAKRCSTVLVEPPMAISTRIAFAKASRVAIAFGSTDASSPS